MSDFFDFEETDQRVSDQKQTSAIGWVSVKSSSSSKEKKTSSTHVQTKEEHPFVSPKELPLTGRLSDAVAPNDWTESGRDVNQRTGFRSGLIEQDGEMPWAETGVASQEAETPRAETGVASQEAETPRVEKEQQMLEHDMDSFDAIEAWLNRRDEQGETEPEETLGADTQRMTEGNDTGSDIHTEANIDTDSEDAWGLSAANQTDPRGSLSDTTLLSNDFSDESYSFLEDLNPEQRQAVKQTEGAVLVLSGAGTGKTRVLTTRIAYILKRRLASPWHILGVTFTNKASREMKDRLEKMIGAAARDVWLGTFHSIGFRILSRYPIEAGLQPNFIVLNADDQERLVKKIMVENGVDTKKYTPAVMLDIIQRWKDRGLEPIRVSPAEDTGFCEGRAKGFYQLYQNRLREMNAVDFGDLLLLPLTMFQNHPDILKRYQNQFRYILVDEYQDTNIAQYLLLRLLSEGYHNICCVGDDDQSIYSWRGAEVQNILKFKEVYPSASIVRLERNYRSSEHILGAASALIAHNSDRLGKTLKVADGRDGRGDKVRVQGFWNGKEEAEKIVDFVEAEQRKGTPLSQMAILVRASFQTREFEEALISAGVPYKIINGFKFYEREEIRDAVAYMRLVLNQNDDLAFLRIVNKPRRGIGDSTIKAISEAAKEHHVSLFDAIAWAQLRPSVRKALDAFTGLIKGWKEQAEVVDLAPLVKQILEESGYIQMWQLDKSPEAEGRIENIKELYNVLDDFETMNDFIEYAALVTDADDNPTEDQLVVMTLHASKGLEFDCVFLPGWEEGLFPHQKSLDEEGVPGLEEERRLAYVGLTRARKKACVSFAANRRVYGQWQNALPSRFVEELPEEHIADFSERKMGYGVGVDDVSTFTNHWSRSIEEGYPQHRLSDYSRNRFGGYSNDDSLSYEREYDGNFGNRYESRENYRYPQRGRYQNHSFNSYEPYPDKGGFGDTETRYSSYSNTDNVEKYRAVKKSRRIGKRVYHETFGYGTVIQESGDHLTVHFDASGQNKKVLARFLSEVS